MCIAFYFAPSIKNNNKNSQQNRRQVEIFFTMTFPYDQFHIWELIRLLENESIPVVENIMKTLREMLKKAEVTRQNCLIAKTTGVSVGAIGTGAAVAGLVFAPLFGGLFLLLPLAGLTLNGLGAATHAGTNITEKILQNDDKEKLGKLFSKFETTKNKWENLLFVNEELKSYLYQLNGDYNEEDIDTKLISNRPKGIQNTNNHVLQWLKSHIFDEEIQIGDIKDGDHIYRPLRKKCKVYPMYHHGIYLGNDEIADFGSAGKKGSSDQTPVIRPLSEFLEEDSSNLLYRRNYKSFAVPVSRTIALAKKIVFGQVAWNPYGLLENNCEHFATFLKLEKSWSEQASSFIVDGVSALKKASQVPKTMVGCQIGVDAMKCLAKVTPSPPFITKFKTVIGITPKTAISTVSKAAVIMGPIMTAVDVAILIYDWNKTHPNIEAMQRTMEMMLKDLTYYKLYLGHLKDILDTNHRRLELGRFQRLSVIIKILDKQTYDTDVAENIIMLKNTST